MSSDSLQPPKALQRVQESTHHSVVLSDEFAWLRMENWADLMTGASPLPEPIRDYLQAEEQYTAQVLEPTEALQKVLYDELRGRIKERDSSVPEPDGDWLYYHRYDEGGQYPLYCRRLRNQADAVEQVLLDGPQEAVGFEYFQLSGCAVSASHRLLAYAVDKVGAELFELYIRELDSGQNIGLTISGTSGDFVFVDEQYILYTLLDEQHRPRFVYRHEIGTDPQNDVLVYEEKDPGFFLGLDKTESEAYVIIDSHDHQTSEVRLVSVAAPLEQAIVVAPRMDSIEYQVSHHNNQLIIRSNYDGAEDFTLFVADLERVFQGDGFSCWAPLIPSQSGRLLLDYHIYQNYLVYLDLVNGMPSIKVSKWDGDNLGPWQTVDIEEEAFGLGLIGSREYDSNILRFVFSSMRVPSCVYDYDMSTQTKVLMKQQEIPTGHNIDDYHVKRVHFESEDGEQIPVSLLYHKQTKIDGSAPLWLHGYGAYGEIEMPTFRSSPLSLVNRGVIYAVAHVRGGMFKGYNWYKKGKLEYKQNTFSDFITCAEGLLQAGYCAKDQIVCYGASAGGMLIGAVVNQRPDLFYAAVAEVPFVDVLNTMLDETLPLTPPEWLEWGNPIEDYQAFMRIKSYAPYENVSAQDYPHMLVLAGLTDPRVTYWEAAKWVARLRARKTGDQQLLLSINMQAGHGGASGRFDYLREVALIQAFVLSKLQIER